MGHRLPAHHVTAETKNLVSVSMAVVATVSTLVLGLLISNANTSFIARNGQVTGHIHVGLRLRERRMVLGMSQTKLAATLGLTFQQVYKYEQGKNRISAGRLYDLSKLLGVPITFFFEGIVGSSPTAPLASGRHNDPLDPREATELFAAYRAISDSVVRRRLRQLAKAFAEGLNGSTAATTRSRNRKPSRRLRSDRGRGAEAR